MNDLEKELRKQLKSDEEKTRSKEIRDKHENKYMNAAIIFFGTLIILYLLFFAGMYLFMYFFGAALHFLQPSTGLLMPFIHAAIWIAAAISVYRERSVLDEIIQRI